MFLLLFIVDVLVLSQRLRAIFFFFQAEDGIRDGHVTGVQTCALPISSPRPRPSDSSVVYPGAQRWPDLLRGSRADRSELRQIGRASCRERVEMSVGAGTWREKTERKWREVVE